MAYNDVLVRACADNGIAAFTGDGTERRRHDYGRLQGHRRLQAAPPSPPSSPGTSTPFKDKLELVPRTAGCFAVAMDVDAAGLPFLKNMNPPAGSKTVAAAGRDRQAGRKAPSSSRAS